MAEQLSGRLCPRCREPLIIVRVPTLSDESNLGALETVDQCRSCHGVFCDELEAEHLIGFRETEQLTNHPSFRLLKPEICCKCGRDLPISKLVQGCPECQFVPKWEGLRCPHCDHAMAQIRILDEMLDLCVHCYGMWMDEGEAGHLAELLKQERGDEPRPSKSGFLGGVVGFMKGLFGGESSEA